MYTLPIVPYLRLRFTLRAKRAAHLVPFHGSLLREAFGQAYRRVSCAVGPELPCARCPLPRECAYLGLSEPLVEGETPPFLSGMALAPRPFVVEPGSNREAFRAGEDLSFDLLLIGRGSAQVGKVILAVERMAPAGLGAGEAPFVLERVEALAPDGTLRPLVAEGRPCAENGPLRSSPQPGLLVGPEGEAEGLSSLPIERLTLRFLTPFRLDEPVGAGSKSRPDLFRPLAQAMLLRVLGLAWFHGAGTPQERWPAALDGEIRRLLNRAEGVGLDPSELTFHDPSRNRQRQDRALPLGGFTGPLRLEGDLTPFGPLLRAAELFHIGQGTSLGWGQFRVEAE